MASFETVVRPVVLPNIRPSAPRVLPPEDDPEKGFVVIKGNPAQSVDLSYSYSFSWASGRQKETEREEDELRVYQQDDDGEINQDNFVDIRVAKKIQMEGAPQPSSDTGSGGLAKEEKTYKYEPAPEADNIEVKRRDVTRKAEEGQGEKGQAEKGSD